MDQASVFGSSVRDRILVALALAGDSHARELARVFDLPQRTIARAGARLERDGLIVALARGRTRVLRLNPRWYATAVLRALLERIADVRPELYEPLTALRARPRRSGKSL